MKTLQLLFSFVLFVAIAACDGGSPESDRQGMARLKALDEEWTMLRDAAASVEKDRLDDGVLRMQAIQQRLQGLAVGKCLSEAKGVLEQHIGQTIDGYLKFMGNDDAGSRAALDAAQASMKKYLEARDKCNG